MTQATKTKAGQPAKVYPDQRFAPDPNANTTAYPILRDPVKGKAFLDATERDAKKYFALDPQDLTIAAEDRRLFKALRYAIKLARLEEAAPKAQQQVASRPAMKGGKRAAPNAQATREKSARTERLRNSGSFEDGVAALMDFDL